MSTMWIVTSFAVAMCMVPALHRMRTSIEQERRPIERQNITANFRDSIAPMLKKNCIPCHFKGGKVFDRLPFDQCETVRALGKKLNTRLKGENAEVVTRWIEQGFPNQSMQTEKTRQH